MYLEYWGFKKFPFENVPDPDFFYQAKSHEEALTRLVYAVEMRKGGAMLTGEVGCGKTILSKVYVKKLAGEKYDIGLIINPKLELIDFLREILYQFDIQNIPDKKVECLWMLNDHMLENMKEKKETLLIVDEAHLLNESTFEEIRLLLNFQLNDRFLMTIILLGQPELRNMIKGIEQLDQRIPLKYHLAPFDLKDTSEYIIYRQKRAGKEENVFEKEAIKRIYEHSNGVPRRINNICDLSLLIGFSTNEKSINLNIVENVIKDGAFF